MRSLGWIVALGAVMASVFTVTWFAGSLSGTSASNGQPWRLVYSLALAVIIVSSFIYVWKERPGVATKNTLTWTVVVFSLAVVFTYRSELNTVVSRIGPGLVPSAATTIGKGQVALRASRGGHFVAAAMVNGTHVDFLVDTGASLVVLTEFDALRLGFTRDELVYNQPVRTANGQTFAAAITLDEIKIGDIEVVSVPGAVLETGLDGSLLGMSFLNQLDSFTIDQDRLIMRR